MRNITSPHTKSKNENQGQPDRLYHRGRREKKPLRPVSHKARQRLVNVALAALGFMPRVELRNQLEIVLFRIAQAKGAAQELPAIQQGEHGTFISQMNPRIYTLREFGFQIENRLDTTCKPHRSWYWLKLSADGTPAMLPVEYISTKDGKPRKAVPSATATPAPEERKPVTGQLFPDAKPVKAWADPELQAQGGGR